MARLAFALLDIFQPSDPPYSVHPDMKSATLALGRAQIDCNIGGDLVIRAVCAACHAPYKGENAPCKCAPCIDCGILSPAPGSRRCPGCASQRS